MKIALIDNGSLEAAAHRNLRAVAAELSARVGVDVAAVSWKHSDRVPPGELDQLPAWTVAKWIRALLAGGEREFVFVPFFISAQGAIGSALRADLEKLQREAGACAFTFTDGLASRDAIVGIVADRIRATVEKKNLVRPAVIVVDHGGPSLASAALRNLLADRVRLELGSGIGALGAASMEGAAHAHNLPLLADLLAHPDFNDGDVVIAPLFLSPGRHAGPDGDLAQIARAAEAAARTTTPTRSLHCHFTDLIGTHPRAVDALASALRATLSALPVFA